MNQNLTEIVFILDRSGSMGKLTSDTIGGYNSFIQQQKEEVGEARLTTVLFDNEYEILHDSINIKSVSNMTNKEYYARGTTAMLDAIGKTINNIGAKLNKMNENDRPANVIFVITTDGYENASVEFKKHQIKEMIEHQQSNYNWKFIFLGANIDSVKEGDSLGIAGGMSANYSGNSIGTQCLYSTMSKATSSLRNSGDIDMGILKEIKW